MSHKEEKPSVFVCPLLGGERGGWPSPPLMRFALECGRIQERGRKIVFKEIMGRVPHDSARNYAVDEFLKTDCQWLLLIDNDMTVHKSIFEMLDSAPAVADVVVPRFFAMTNGGTEQTPQMALSLCWYLRPSDPPGRGDWTEIDGSGSGVLAIRRRVFAEMIDKPYFRFGYDADGHMVEGEDLMFSKKVKAAGGRFFGSNIYECGHVHSVDLSLLARIAGCAGRPPGELVETRLIETRR